EVTSKRLELLRELMPRIRRLAVLVNPSNAAISETTVRAIEAAARGMGAQVQVFNAGTSGEIDDAFANFVREHSDAVFVGGDAFFTSRRVQLATLAARYMIPSSFSQRDVTEVGGLMSTRQTIGIRIVSSASMPVASSRAPSPQTCRLCSRLSSN